MNVFSQTQRYKALFWLSLFHLLVITSSNYLVQLPVSIFGFHTTWGAFSFPFIFLATDLTVRIFGAPLARRIIFAVMIPALLISYVISSLFYMGSWQGFGALAHFNLFVARIATSVITRLRPVPPPPDKSPGRPPNSSPAQPVVRSRQAINP